MLVHDYWQPDRHINILACWEVSNTNNVGRIWLRLSEPQYQMDISIVLVNIHQERSHPTWLWFKNVYCLSQCPLGCVISLDHFLSASSGNEYMVFVTSWLVCLFSQPDCFLEIIEFGSMYKIDQDLDFCFGNVQIQSCKFDPLESSNNQSI